ncbi:serine/threonine protein kinase [Azoarcus taiwanensis]|uniref:Stress response kinase A n=1 Tax=Azoarcus taiwanensis TaxID=666964 RepID=A0A972J913_9RHOO|nr:serine/threonine protein kinase [Azoarcus taiwanensis]NMG03981.1 serine/threonine protein kinase [Azoarcus taiwanensis]
MPNRSATSNQASDANPTPFSTLTPDRMLDAIESLGLVSDGRMLALNSYENRVYQFGIEDGPMMVAKFYRAGRWSDEAILEEHAFAIELAEREIPVVPPLAFETCTLHTCEDLRFALYPRVAGRAPELSDPHTLEWMGRFLGRIHAIGALRPFVSRPALDIAGFGEDPRDFLLAHDFIPNDLLDAWRSTVDQALDGVRRCFDRAGDFTRIRLHGDCHAGNVLWNERGEPPGPQFVDFDDARMGPAVQDLWMLLSGERAEMSRQLGDVLAGYEDFFDFSTRELHLVEALRTLRLIHYSAWIARRWDDPAFPVAFPWFNTQRYWQDRILELREQIALMDEAPLWSQ